MNVVPLDASSNGNVPVAPHFHELEKAIHCLNNKTDVSQFGTKMHTEYFWVKKKVFSCIANTGYSIFRRKDVLVSKLGLTGLVLFLGSASDFLCDFGQVS